MMAVPVFAAGNADRSDDGNSDHQHSVAAEFPMLTVSLVEYQPPSGDLAGWDRAQETAKDPLIKIDNALAAANHRLCVETEPMLSRLVMHIEQPTDSDAAREIVGDVRKRLAAVEPMLHSEQDEIDADQLRRRINQWEQLDAFAGAIASWLQPAIDESAVEATVSALSILLEDDRNDVSAAASLWQVMLLTKMGAHEQALRRLEVTTAPPRRNAVRQDFLRRCLRAQILIDQGKLTAADAALLVLEEKSRPWFNTEAEKDLASRTAAWFRYRSLKKWNEAALAADNTDEANWTAETATRLVDESFEDADDRTILRLYESVPLTAALLQPQDP